MDSKSQSNTARIIASLCVILSLTCCFCGNVLILPALFPTPGNKFVLSDGLLADPQLQRQVALSTFFTILTISILLILFGGVIWLRFGRDTERAFRVKPSATLLGFASFASFIWGINVAITGFATDGMIANGEQLGALVSLIGTLGCFTLGVLLGLISLGLHLYFRQSKPDTTKELSQDFIVFSAENDLIIIDQFNQFVNRSLSKFDDKNDLSLLIRAQIKLALQGLRPEARGSLILILYENSLLGEDFAIALNDFDFGNSNLDNANLKGANLKNINLSRANLLGVNFEESNLENSNLVGVDIRRANLSGANLKNANLSDSKCHECDFKRASFSGTVLQNANFWKTSLLNTYLSEDQIRSLKTYSESTFAK